MLVRGEMPRRMPGMPAAAAAGTNFAHSGGSASEASAWTEDAAPRPAERWTPAPSAAPPLSYVHEAAAAAEGPLACLNETQREALELSREHAAGLSRLKYDRLCSRAAGLGYDETAVGKALTFVRDEAPFHIYFDPDRRLPDGLTVLDHLSTDSHYRNAFETGASAGNGGRLWQMYRDDWERTLFRGAYHRHRLIPKERPKYGALRIAGASVPGASSYFGGLFLIGGDHLKRRLTLTPRDSSDCTADEVGTPDHAAHVLSGIREPQQLEELLRVAVEGPGAPSLARYGFVEGQLHGPAEHPEDFAGLGVVEALVPKRHIPRLRELSEARDLPLSWDIGTGELVPDGA